MDITETSCRSSECNEIVQRRSIGNELAGWTKDEKFDLLQALKLSGSYDIDSIQMIVANKTREQIKEAIDYYKKKASLLPAIVERDRRERSSNGGPRVPLANWAKFLVDSVGFQDLQTEISNALHLITELETSIPPPVCTENIDFKKIYKMISYAIEGKPLPEYKVAAILLDKCIMETALCTKAFIRLSSLKYILDNINVKDTEIKTVPRGVGDHEERTIKYLASQKNYNPLNIPEKYLKATKS